MEYRKIKDEEKIIDDYKVGNNISMLQKKHGGSKKTLRKILFNAGLIDSIEPKRKFKIEGKNNVEIKNALLLRYESEKDIDILANEFNINRSCVYYFLRREKTFDAKYGINNRNERIRKYPINEHFFDEIDCEEKAYFLGILYADGTNSLKKTEVSLRLQEGDYEILEKLNNLIQPEKPINPVTKFSSQNLQYKLCINSKIISYKLNDLGMIPNKTFNLEYPLWLRNDLHRHFIRGYFDGDGCATFNKSNKYLIFSFTGTENMVLCIQNILIEQCGLNKVKFQTRYPERNNNIRSLSYSGNGNSKKYYKYIYDNAKIYMKRKKDKFDKHLKTN